MSDLLRTSVEALSSSSKRFFKVVLTGGPCAGKTSALAIISGMVFRCFSVSND